MDTAKMICPVILMLALGALSSKLQIISENHNAGIKKLIFTILLPILVFNASFTMSIEQKYLKVMLFMFILQCICLALGHVLFRFLKMPYGHIAPCLMTTIEGGNAFYPLYISLVGTGFTSYFVLLDVPGIFMIFLVIPLLLAGSSKEKNSPGDILRSVFQNPVVCALIAGLLLNITGAASAFLSLPVADVYHEIITSACAPIAPLILFTLGHSFKIGRENLLPMLGTLAARLLLMGGGIAAALCLFPWIRSDRPLLIAVILFLMSPPAFAMPIIIEKKFRHAQDGTFCSTYISLHMLFTVLCFAFIAIFAGA